MRNSNFNKNFERRFQMMSYLFWFSFVIVLIMIASSWFFMGFGIYTVITDPDAAGTFVADVIRPVVNVIKGE